jgi:uncharacterized protein
MMDDVTSADVVDDPASHRFQIMLGDDDVAAAYYRRDADGHLILTHTEVPSEYGGRGIASTLARGVFDQARDRGDKLVLRCPFMAAWYAKHREYGDVVAG